MAGSHLRLQLAKESHHNCAVGSHPMSEPFIQVHAASVLTPTNGSLPFQSQGCASPTMTGTAWPAAPWMAAFPCASWYLPHPLCSVCCEATPVVSQTLLGLSPMTSLCPPHLMPPCASGPLRTAAASGRSLTLMAPNCSAALFNLSTTTSLWSGSREPAHHGAVGGHRVEGLGAPQAHHSSLAVVGFKGRNPDKWEGRVVCSLKWLCWVDSRRVGESWLWDPLGLSARVLQLSICRGCCWGTR